MTYRELLRLVNQDIPILTIFLHEVREDLTQMIKMICPNLAYGWENKTLEPGFAKVIYCCMHEALAFTAMRFASSSPDSFYQESWYERATEVARSFRRHLLAVFPAVDFEEVKIGSPVRKAMEDLAEKGLAEIVPQDEGPAIMLTPEGERWVQSIFGLGNENS